MTRSLSILVALAACSQDAPEPSSEVAVPAAVLQDPDGDADGDGLSNQAEWTGWTLSVNRSGHLDDRQEWPVRSDPTVADTDGDGLDDGEEQRQGTDPAAADTDGDGLDDRAELERWGTNPLHPDTDGDALTPADAAFAGAPLPALFDGAELRLDAAGDAGPAATSPTLADTDGDGFTDREEYITSSRDPGVAESAGFYITLTEGTVIDLSVDVTYEGATTDVVSHATSIQVDEAEETATSTFASAALANESSFRFRSFLSITGGCCLDIADATAGFESELRARMTAETSMGASLSLSDSAASTQTYSDYVERSTFEASTIDGATVQASVDIVNPTARAYTVEGLSVVVFYRSEGELRPLAVLTGLSDTLTLGPGERLPNVLLRDDGADPTHVLEMMAEPDRLLVSPASYDLTDVTGAPVAFQLEVVQERTATVVVHHEDRVARHHVAVNVHRDAAGVPTGLTTGQVFDKLGLVAHDDTIANPVTGESELEVVIEGQGVVFHDVTSDDPLDGLDRGGYPVTGGPGERIFAEQWIALMYRDGGEVPELASMLDLSLLPGDVVEFVRGVDRDRDGLADVEEQLMGTSDGRVDSDASDGQSDGLSDFFETYEPWTVSVAGRTPYEVYGHPTARDADSDGLHDGEELAAGTDPRLVDTDGDGWSDASELAGGQSPLVPNDGLDDVVIQCRAVHDGAGTWLYEVFVDAEPDLIEVVGMRRNGSEVVDPLLVEPQALRTEFHADYPTTLGPAPTVYAVDDLGLELAVQCPEPLPAYGKTCLNCPETLPSVSCTVREDSGAVDVHVSDAGEDLVSVALDVEVDIGWHGEYVDFLTRCPTFGSDASFEGINYSFPTSFATAGNLSATADVPMRSSWTTVNTALPPLEGAPLPYLSSLDFVFGSGSTDELFVGAYGSGGTALGDLDCMTHLGHVMAPLLPYRYETEVSVVAADVDGQVATAVCAFSLADEALPRSCHALALNEPGTPSGFYDIDPLGTGSSRRVWCEMDDLGGGWTLVRHTAGSGDWGPFTDNLQGTYEFEPWHYPTTPFTTLANEPTFGIRYDDINFAEVWFRAGDEASSCVLGRSHTRAFHRSEDEVRANILYSDNSSGNGDLLVLPADEPTNVLNRTENVEDPWVGCNGNHADNAYRGMFYGEGSSGDHVHRKNESGGMSVYVR